MSTEENWKVLDDADIDQTGFVIVPVDVGDAYIAKSHSSLFETRDAANDVVAAMVAKGMPIGAAKVVEAKLTQKRYLAIKLEDKPKLVVLADGQE